MKRFGSYLAVAGATLGMCMSAHGDYPTTGDLYMGEVTYTGFKTGPAPVAPSDKFSILAAYGVSKVDTASGIVEIANFHGSGTTADPKYVGARVWLGSDPDGWSTTMPGWICTTQQNCTGTPPPDAHIVPPAQTWEGGYGINNYRFMQPLMLMGKTLSIEMDFSNYGDDGCGCLAEVVLVATNVADHHNQSPNYDPYYCDCQAQGDPSKSQYCYEIDLFEGNNFGFVSTLHNNIQGGRVDYVGCGFRVGQTQTGCPCADDGGNFNPQYTSNECNDVNAYYDLLTSPNAPSLRRTEAYGPGSAGIDTDYPFTLNAGFKSSGQNELANFYISVSQTSTQNPHGQRGPFIIGEISSGNIPKWCCPVGNNKCDDSENWDNSDIWDGLGQALKGGMSLYVGTNGTVIPSGTINQHDNPAEWQNAPDCQAHPNMNCTRYAGCADFTDARPISTGESWGATGKCTGYREYNTSGTTPKQPVGGQYVWGLGAGQDLVTCGLVNKTATDGALKVGAFSVDNYSDPGNGPDIYHNCIALAYCNEDINGSGDVDIEDLLMVIDSWGDSDCQVTP